MAEADVVTLIEQDHREIERLLTELETDREDRPQLLEKAAALLVAHNRAEEAEVYPAAREEADGLGQVERGADEHAETERLLHQLHDTDPAAAEFDHQLATLVEAIRHHVGEEERTVLPGLVAQLDEQRLRELGAAFESRKLIELQQNPH